MRATVARGRVAVLAVAIACAAAAAAGDDAPTWIDVVADSPLDHTVTVRGPFIDAHEKVRVTGPVGVTTSGAACFTVYAVAARGDEPERAAMVGTREVPLRLGPAAFLLVPARRLRDGVPAPEAPGGVYEIRPLLDPPQAIDGMPEPCGRPTHLCLPVDYRHHFERMPVADAARGLLVFAPRAAEPAAATMAVADDFGINRLAVRATRRDGLWVSVRMADHH